MQIKLDSLTPFIIILFSSLQKSRKRTLSKSFYKLQIAFITSNITSGKISSTPIQNYSFINRSLSYTSIKPSQQYYTTKSQQHNYNAQTIDINQNFTSFQEKYTKENYFQKYLNQTVTQYHRLWHFPASQFLGKNIGNYNPQALDTILKTDHKEFFESLLVKRKSWGKLETPAHRLEYKKSMQTPLTGIRQQYNDQAIEIFNMLFTMQSTQFAFPKHHFMATIINKIISAEDQLKDQIFLQIIKQMSSTERHNDYLPLFVAVCTVVKVSLRMYIPLLNYLIHKSKKSINAYSCIFYAAIRNFASPRKGPITSCQALFLMKLRQVGVTVCFPTEKTFYFDVHVDVEDVLNEIVKFYQLDSKHKYLLFYRGRYFETGKMMDCFAQAVHDKDFMPQYTAFNGYKVLIIFKNMVDSTLSKTNNDLLYCYCASMYLNSLFLLTRDQIITISALKYYAQNDSIDLCQITKYIPRQYYISHQDSNLERLMVSSIQGITCTKCQARNKILQILKTQDAFMSFIFQAEMFFQQQDTQYVQIDLYLKPGRLILVGRGEYSCYRHIKLSQVKKWGRSKKKLCLVVEKFGKVYIESRDTELIVEVFEEYVKALEKYTEGK